MHYSELLSLLGQSLDSPICEKFFNHYDLHGQRQKSSTFDWLWLPHFGVMFRTDRELITQIDLGGNCSTWDAIDTTPYVGLLPYDVKFGDKRRIVEEKSGRKPDLVGYRLLTSEKIMSDTTLSEQREILARRQTSPPFTWVAYFADEIDFRFWFDPNFDGSLVMVNLAPLDNELVQSVARESADLDNSIIAYLKMLDADPKSMRIVDLADCYWRKGDTLRAEDSYKSGIQNATFQSLDALVSARTSYARFLCSNQRNEEALAQLIANWRDLEKAISKKPNALENCKNAIRNVASLIGPKDEELIALMNTWDK